MGSAPPPPMDEGGLDQQAAPAVAAPPGKALMVLGIVIVMVVFLLSQIFGGDDEVAVTSDEPQVRQVAASQKGPSGGDDPIGLPDLIDTGPSALPPPPPPDIQIIPPSLPPSTNVPLVSRNEPAEIDNEMLRARQRSNMLVFNDGDSGGAGFFGGPELDGAAARPTDPDEDFAMRVSNTEAEKAIARHIGDLRTVVAQGRLIHAVLESGINTDLPGPIRAIVSRDTLPEAGREKIIPKGSRLIGRYNSDIQDGQARILVIWTRLIRPDGVDIQLGSPAVDSIGVAGVPGNVDNKFMEVFSRALLTSSINIGLAIGASEIIGDENNNTSSTNSGDGSTTESGSAAALATVDALDRLGNVTENFLDRFINVRPTITLDQGTKMNVFVNRDLIFPTGVAGTRIIQ